MPRMLSAKEFVMSPFCRGRAFFDSSTGRRGRSQCSWLLRSLFAGIVVSTFLCCSALPGQDPQAPVLKQRPQTVQPADQATAENPVEAANAREDEKPVANLTARQKQIAADKSKLLKLATELKKEIDKSGAGTLSVTAIRKANEIEKLAHTVRQEMNEDQNHAP